jgi:Na+/melibiose symporter-like transporter
MERFKDLDYIGPLIFIPANVLLLLALQFGGSKFQWNAAVVITLLVFAMILFVLWVYSQYRLGDKATIPLRVMRQRTVVFTSIFGFFAFGAMSILCTYIPYFLQAIDDSSALESGIQSLPFLVSATLFAVVGGVLITFIGYYAPIMILGTVLFTIASGLFTTIGVHTPFRTIVGIQLLAGAGIGMNLQVRPPIDIN